MTTIVQANIKSATCVLKKTRVQGFCRSEEKCIEKCEKKHFQMGGVCLGKFWIKMCFCLKPCITPAGGGSPKKVHVGEPSKKSSTGTKPWNQPWVNTLVSPIVRRAFAHAPWKSPVKHTASSSSNGPVHPPAYAPVRPPAYAPVRPPAYAPVRPPAYAPARTPTEAVSD